MIIKVFQIKQDDSVTQPKDFGRFGSKLPLLGNCFNMPSRNYPVPSSAVLCALNSGGEQMLAALVPTPIQRAG